MKWDWRGRVWVRDAGNISTNTWPICVVFSGKGTRISPAHYAQSCGASCAPTAPSWSMCHSAAVSRMKEAALEEREGRIRHG